MAEAGYPNGFTTTILVQNVKQYEDAAVAAKGELAKLGITARLEIVEGGIWVSRRVAGNFDFIALSPVTVELGDPDMVLSRGVTGSPSNYFRYSNPKVDELYRQQSQTLDASQRKRIVLDIQHLLMEDLPYVPWFWLNYYAIVSTRVKGFHLLGLYPGHSMEDVWLAR
mgnify:CR=1 FL=1